MALTKVKDGLVDQDLTIVGGTVNNSVIGGSTAAAGSFITYTLSKNALHTYFEIVLIRSSLSCSRRFSV